MCDYYVKWINGLKRVHGLDLDAIGCRNEKGVDEKFIKMLRKTLNTAGLQSVKTHGFDNWGKTKFDWVKDLATDPELRDAVDIISNHTMSEIPADANVQQIAAQLGKPIWNTEEHVYKKGFDDELSLVHVFNDNFITSHVTKVITWYLAGGVYDNEPYPEDPAILIANTPWSGHYHVREVLWGYAHYGQFSAIGWNYVPSGCAKLDGGGSVITLKAPANSNNPNSPPDYSVIAETQGATAPQTVTLKLASSMSPSALCMWTSDKNEQFVHQPDVSPTDGVITLTLQPDTIYSLSTTRGQQKGEYKGIPEAKPFPLPYADDFEHYENPASWGYLPHYTADITGVFELAARPDGKGTCLKQVLPNAAQTWAPEWMPYTIVGDPTWTDYEVSADITVANDGWAGVMGRVSSTGGGYGCNPKGYYIRLYEDGRCELYISNARKNGAPGKLLASGNTAGFAGQWRNVKLRFQGSKITGLVDDNEIVSATDTTYTHGNAGLTAGGEGTVRDPAMFDNLLISPANSSGMPASVAPAGVVAMYKP